MKTKHTPTPWKQSGIDIYSAQTESRKQNRYYIVKQDEHCISKFDENKKEHELNAAHIVKCVNLHDELVELLENLLQETKHRKIEPYKAAQVQDLLKRAKGEV